MKFQLILLAIGLLHSVNGVKISYNEFISAVTNNGYPRPTRNQYDHFMSNLEYGQISSKQEAAMALAQFIHESGGLLEIRETDCARSGCPGSYEYPGCDAPGEDYYGRGYIQLSWCYNYKAASKDLYGDASYLVNNPDLVADDEDIAWATSFWFWGKNCHNNGGTSGEFGATTNAINGERECTGGPSATAKRRFQIYERVRAAFGLRGPGNANGCWQ